jgi:heme exporter protein C
MTTITPQSLEVPARRRGTGTRATRIIGLATIVMIGWLAVFGLLISPADRDQGDSVRIMYVHVPSVWLAYLAFIVTAICSAIHLFGRRHSLGVDRVAGASAEVGVVFMAVTLVTGMLWGRITWGVYWQWDARLTTTALLFISYIGYLAVRGLKRSDRAVGGSRNPAGALECQTVAQPSPGGDGARH